MKSTSLLFLLCLACDPPTPEEHCEISCRFYSECDPALEPLEDMCIQMCNMRLGDPKMVVTTCANSAPRIGFDQFMERPSLLSTVIDAGECARDQGCPPEMPDPNADDPCEDIEQVCLDSLTPEDLCYRTYWIDTDRCSRGYSVCIETNTPELCATQSQSCYQQAGIALTDCLART